MIRNIDSTPTAPVDMDGVSGVEMAVMVGRNDGAPNFAVRQFKVQPGGHTPHHSHDFEHEVYVVDGEGAILLNGQQQPIRGGDVIYVPANEVHQFRATGKTDPLRFLCMVPMSRECGDPTPGS